MCTLTLAWQVFEGAPVVVAANRDERLNRESEPPAVRDWETRTVAPQDAEAGGTWLGYNEHGVLVAITNRWLDTELTAERSRGLLVRDALRHGSAEAAARYVEHELEAQDYDGFNLLAVDDAAAVLVEWVGRPRVHTLDPGVHVVVNVGADGSYTVPSVRFDAGKKQATNADTLRMALRPEPGETGRKWLERAGTAIGDHDYGVCIHGEGFGTRSSSLVFIPDDGPATYEFADGPPCETSFERVDATF